MATRPRTYRGEQIDVTYEIRRCIHAAECVKRLSAVFDRNKVPWVEPNNAPADQLAETIMQCPSGALHFERKDGGSNESAPSTNTIQVVEDGPLYIKGDVTIIHDDQTLILQDTRVALCRCGASHNKPFCDNTHEAIHFQASGTRPANAPVTLLTEGGALTINPGKNDSLHITGNFTVLAADGQPIASGTEEWFCRCGASNNKPFCDSSHKRIGFEAD